MRYRKREWQEKLVNKNINCLVFNDFSFIKKYENKINLEIGSGKGDFIVDQAKKNSNEIFIGIERVKSVLAMALKKVIDEKVNNVFFLCDDAQKLLEKEEIKERISKIYLNFSDPWPKKRHEKRRLTSPVFFNLYKSTLEDGGRLFLKTDNKQLFDYSVKTLNEKGFEIFFLSENYKSEENNKDSMTEYEKKFRENKVKINKVSVILNK